MEDNLGGSDGHTTQPSRAPHQPAAAPSWPGARILDARAPLEISATAAGATAAWARHQFADWLAVDLPAGDLFQDLVLVVYEALANTVDHAYINTTTGTGPVELIARRSHDAVHITVSDHGTWRDTPTTPTTPTFRGHGLPLIRQLIHDVHIELGSTGTTVHLRTPLPPVVSTARYACDV